MTYRRLYRYYVMFCTLALAVFWWLSLQPRSSYNLLMPGRHLHMRFHSGAVILITHEGPFPKLEFQSTAVPALSMYFLQKFPHGPFGAIRAGSLVNFGGATEPFHYLVFPFWLAYLLALGAGTLVLKGLERRAGSLEKWMEKRDGDRPGI